MNNQATAEISGKSLQTIVRFYPPQVMKLIAFLYREKYTVAEVASILGVTRAAVSLQYPKSKLLKEYESR